MVSYKVLPVLAGGKTAEASENVELGRKKLGVRFFR